VTCCESKLTWDRTFRTEHKIFPNPASTSRAIWSREADVLATPIIIAARTVRHSICRRRAVTQYNQCLWTWHW